MNRLVLGAVSALLLAGAGLFWWQGQAATDAAAPPPPPIPVEQLTGAPLEDIPDEDGEGLQGGALPGINEASREEKRFNRLDRNRDSLISRTEALQPRIAAFRKLDKDGNNLLSFEEWAVTTTNKFKKADSDGNGNLNRAEFATTKPKPSKKPGCRC
jgi:EF hand